jgi:hypothetical protein
LNLITREDAGEEFAHDGETRNEFAAKAAEDMVNAMTDAVMSYIEAEGISRCVLIHLQER